MGKLRPRPNKWRIEMAPSGDVWKEWGYARDAHGQHVYHERWERYAGSQGDYLAFRRSVASHNIRPPTQPQMTHS